MARYQIIIAYDGTDFSGSQIQAESRTVQNEIEKALKNLGWNGKSVLLAGRTDAGVHASGQVAAFDIDWRHTLPEMQNALNANLPLDLSVNQVYSVDDTFHPRFDASWRRYRYRLFNKPVRDPLRERFAWRVWPEVKDLQSLSNIWLGTHDFVAFGSPPRSGGSTVRSVLETKWEQKQDEWYFEIKANAFLYHMVRKIVFSQVAVGKGKMSKEDLVKALEGQGELPSGIAPPNGLTLIEVGYE